MKKPELKRVKISALNRQWPVARFRDASTPLAVHKQIEELGVLAPPTVSRKTMKLLSLDGVVESAMLRGDKDIEVWMVDLTPEQEEAAYLALNNHFNNFDWQKVAEKLKAMNGKGDVALHVAGFCAAKTAALTRTGDWVPPVPERLDGEQKTQTDFNF